MKRAPVIIFLQGNDVQLILGVSKTTAYKILTQLRCAYGKTGKQPVTLEELCQHERLGLALAGARIGY